jgi:membrane protease YdiL (CAAX protease family)
VADAAAAARFFRLAAAVYLALAVAGVVWLGWRVGRIPLSAFLDPAGWALDFGLGLAAAGLLTGLWEGTRRLSSRARELERELAALLGPQGPSEVLALALLSGVAEEVFFRGAMLPAWGLLLTTIVFTVLHSGPGPAYRLWTLFALVGGVLFASLVLWRGNLLPAIVAHVVVNAVGLHRLAADRAAGAT